MTAATAPARNSPSWLLALMKVDSPRSRATPLLGRSSCTTSGEPRSHHVRAPPTASATIDNAKFSETRTHITTRRRCRPRAAACVRRDVPAPKAPAPPAMTSAPSAVRRAAGPAPRPHLQDILGVDRSRGGDATSTTAKRSSEIAPSATFWPLRGTRTPRTHRGPRNRTPGMREPSRDRKPVASESGSSRSTRRTPPRPRHRGSRHVGAADHVRSSWRPCSPPWRAQAARAAPATHDRLHRRVCSRGRAQRDADREDDLAPGKIGVGGPASPAPLRPAARGSRRSPCGRSNTFGRSGRREW